MTRARPTADVRARAVQRYHDGDPTDEIAADAQVTPTSVMIWVRKAAAEAGETPQRQGQRRRRSRRADVPPGLVRWLYDQAELSHTLIARLTRMAPDAAWQRYYGEVARDEIATEAEVGRWLGERRPDLLLATMKYVAAISSAVTVDGKRT